jgi:HEAT repeat protein
LAGLGVIMFWPGKVQRVEPEYQGKKLSEWLREYRQPLGANITLQESADAVRHIGTNALPFLVKCIQDDEDMPHWRTKLFDIACTWNTQLHVRDKALEIITQRQLLGRDATWGFQILGQRASAAIPELIPVARNGNQLSASQALRALSFLGQEGLSPVLAFASDQSFKWRIQAISVLGEMAGRGGGPRHAAVVYLIEHLKDPDPKIVCVTADALGALNLENEISVPPLADLIQSTDETIRQSGLANLGRFGVRARPVLPQVLAALRDSNADVRRSTTNALLKIAPEVLTNGVKEF